MSSKIKFLAYYLPQYHPIPENDEWWGKGFTEWTNVTKAKSFFKGHYQPRYPKDLGYYDLRIPEVREAQAELAKHYGISGFVYYHYWFGNKRQLLERPFNEVLKSKEPKFPFLLCWANEDWNGVWFGASKGQRLITQEYPGQKDYIDHFRYLFKAFTDPRYISIDGKPVFHVYNISSIPNLHEFVEIFQNEAIRHGLKGIYLLAGNVNNEWDPRNYGFDGVVSNNFHRIRLTAKKYFTDHNNSLLSRLERRVNNLFDNIDPEKRFKPLVIDYHKMTELVKSWPLVNYDYFPQVIPDWDNSARAGKKSLILKDSTPEKWKQHLNDALNYVNNFSTNKKIVFIKSWNEWAEGNYLEPDQKWGHAYLEKMKEALDSFCNV